MGNLGDQAVSKSVDQTANKTTVQSALSKGQSSSAKGNLKETASNDKAPTSTPIFTVVKRNGTLVPFRRDRIFMAIEAAFREVHKISLTEPLPADLYRAVQDVTNLVSEDVLKRAQEGACLTVEGIQDLVEIKLMHAGHHDVARSYILYRDERKAHREDSARNLKVMRRDGTTVRFIPMKIASAVEKAFRATKKISGPTPGEIINAVNLVTSRVVARAVELNKQDVLLHIELMQDEVERMLMSEGFFDVAKDYIIYRAKRSEARIADDAWKASQPEVKSVADGGKKYNVLLQDGSTKVITEGDIRKRIAHACKEFDQLIDVEEIVQGTLLNFYDGIKAEEVDLACLMGVRSKVEIDPAYSKVAARLLLDLNYREAVGVDASDARLEVAHKVYFKEYVKKAISIERLSPTLLDFDLDKLGAALDLSRDHQFTYLGMQTLYDRYFIHQNELRLETPQIFWMRVAMGLSVNEGKAKNERAIEFYDVLSKFLFVSSTPTLFNAGTLHPQLSSCYLSTIMDDLQHIFKVVSDDAQLSKWAGGLGNDWTNVRATGARIKGTNGKSQGVIPFLKVANDTAVAVNQGGKRKGAMCAYLETWHLDVEDFLELRKNTGDERRRTHDMNTANWIPDLFMKRVINNGHWTLFSPSDVPDLHDLYGSAFEKRYTQYEEMADRGELKLFKRIEAVQLWRKMLGMLFETGHPWITFKDPSNIRSPQDHVGVVHSSNLCTEILLNTSREETAVCNLGSINLAAHTTKQGLNKDLIAKSVRTGIRMLDNVIDINFYPTPEAKTANERHRPVGLGIMGFQDALYIQGFSYASKQAVDFADSSMEAISYYAILASSELAKERGAYSTFKGSKWDRGLMPIDTIKLLADERAGYLEVDMSTSMDWSVVRKSVKQHGMRNSNTMAIAPTATISNISGVGQSIEPTYKHLFVKSNLSGEFTTPNIYLVEELKKRSLWDAEMVDDLKYFDGSIVEIERIPEDVKQLFVTAFEIEPEWIIECASRRQKWIDMGQSLNLYINEPSGKKLHNMYIHAWTKGLKTTYYLRSLGATQIEKSTTDVNKRGLQPRWMKSKSASSNIVIDRSEPSEQLAAPKVCSMEEGCESCQ